jgi:hypothetical protein
MDQPFGFEATKENYLAMHSGVPSKVRQQPSPAHKHSFMSRELYQTFKFAVQASSQGSRQAFGNISNSGCFVVSCWSHRPSLLGVALPNRL